MHPESWGVIEKSEVFLLNYDMYQLCKSEKEPFFHLETSTADQLQEVFLEHMFVVAAAGHTE